jgi:hypothetical protein
LGDWVGAWGDEETLARDLDTVGAWLYFIALEFATSAFEATFDDTVTAAYTRLLPVCLSLFD